MKRKTTRTRKRSPTITIPLPAPKPSVPPLNFELHHPAAQQLVHNLAALFSHYGIPARFENGLLLAMCLASDSVRDFRPTVPKPHRPRGRQPKLKAGHRDLLLYLTWMGKEPGEEHERVRELGQNWRATGFYSWSDRSLIRRYEELKNSGPTKGMLAYCGSLSTGR